MEITKLNPPELKSTLNEQLEDVKSRINDIRQEMREKADLIVTGTAGILAKTTGAVFIEDVGALVDVKNGNYQYFYDKHAIQLRNTAMLDHEENERIYLFEAISSVFLEKSTILNIGAGGDRSMVKGLLRHNHNVVNTDFSQDAIDIIKQATGTEGFACDLIHLDKVLPQNSINIIMGNSVLGYLDPKKIRKVADNLARIMDKGAVFTFDMSPHPNYSLILKPKKEKTVVNDSTIDPADLLENVEKYGPEKGIQITNCETSIKSIALKCALMELWRTLFKEYGFRTNLTMTQTPIGLMGILRVAKHDQSILKQIDGEDSFDDANSMFRAYSQTHKIPYVCLDSHFSPIIAKKLGIACDNPLRLFYKVSYQTPDLPDKEKQLIQEEYLPSKTIEKIMPFINGEKTIEEPKENKAFLKHYKEQVQSKQFIFQRIHSPEFEAQLRSMFEPSANQNIKTPDQRRKDRNKRKKNQK